MATLKEVIDVLTEVQSLDPENENAKVQIYNKCIFITRDIILKLNKIIFKTLHNLDTWNLLLQLKVI